MKITTFIDKDREEEVIVYLKDNSDLPDKIAKLLEPSPLPLIGYTDAEAVALDPDGIYCFTVEGGKVYALTERERFQLRERLYAIEEALGDDFVKINQSCLVNVKKIARFDASLGGSLLVKLKNGYGDYVSRRQLKTVKERIGLRL